MINCYILDDYPSQFKVLKILIESTEGLKLTGTETNSNRFLQQYKEHKLDIDLLFLDIQMSGISGIELAALLDSKTKIVFTTGHRDFAFEAFELHAVDYLLKPIRPARFLEAVTKARKLILQEKNIPDTLISGPKDLYVKGTGKSSWNRINLNEIVYLKADSNYTNIVLQAKQVMVYGTLNNLSKELPQERFLRVHKSYIINLSHVESGSVCFVNMGNGDQVPVGRAYRNELKAHLKF